MQEGVVGVDLGGTFTKFGLVTREGRLLASSSIPTDSTLPYRVFFKQLYKQIKELILSADQDIDLKGIGIGAPTGNSFTGTIEHASNLDWPGEVPVTDVMEAYTNLTSVLVNDADAAAMGEILYGAAQGLNNFISLTMGTGLGCGIVVNGKLVVGHSGHAGEIGHTTVFLDGRPCNCGRLGCLEAYVSAPGILYTARELMKTTPMESKLRSIPDSALEAKTITEAALQNDRLAIETFTYTGKILGLKLVDIVAFTNPEAIIVSGGLVKAGALILEPAKKSLEKNVLSIYQDKIDIITSSLTQKNAAILGAAAFMWNKLEENKSLSKTYFNDS